ncbi:hypothetical protein CBL_20353 [Carabus blaptoides fortunei]
MAVVWEYMGVFSWERGFFLVGRLGLVLGVIISCHKQRHVNKAKWMPAKKIKKEKNDSLSTLHGSMLQYLKRADDGRDSSKDTVLQPPSFRCGGNSPKVHNHESSEEHFNCREKWKTLAVGLRLHKTIDAESIALMHIENKRWRDILHKLLDITLYLAKQNLAFRGHNEDESASNKGNYLEMVEMLSKYTPVLKEIKTKHM